jgi:hypothetical protein
LGEKRKKRWRKSLKLFPKMQDQRRRRRWKVRRFGKSEEKDEKSYL